MGARRTSRATAFWGSSYVARWYERARDLIGVQPDHTCSRVQLSCDIGDFASVSRLYDHLQSYIETSQSETAPDLSLLSARQLQLYLEVGVKYFDRPRSLTHTRMQQERVLRIEHAIGTTTFENTEVIYRNCGL